MRPELATLIGTVAVGIIGLLSAWIAKRTRSPQDVEQIRLAQQEIASKAVSTAAALIDEVREQQVAQKTDYEGRIADLRTKSDAEIGALNGRITNLEDRHTRILAALIAHAPWDTTALEKLRLSDPTWPPPPPLDPPH